MINDNQWYKSMLVGNRSDLLSDYELIATAFGTGSSPTIEFTSIPTTYKHLQVRWTARSTGTGQSMTLRLNGATTGYSHHGLYGNGTSVLSENYVSQTSIALLSAVAHNSSPAGVVGPGVMDILDYASTTKNTTTRAIFGQSTVSYAERVNLHSGLFNNTSAITSLAFTHAGNNFASISRFSLYGIRG